MFDRFRCRDVVIQEGVLYCNDYLARNVIIQKTIRQQKTKFDVVKEFGSIITMPSWTWIQLSLASCGVGLRQWKPIS